MKSSPPGLSGPSWGPAMYPSSDIDMSRTDLDIGAPISVLVGGSHLVPGGSDGPTWSASGINLRPDPELLQRNRLCRTPISLVGPTGFLREATPGAWIWPRQGRVRVPTTHDPESALRSTPGQRCPRDRHATVPREASGTAPAA